MYLRFRTSFLNDYEETRFGVFQAAYFLLQSDSMYVYDQSRLEDVWQWFKDNLYQPSVYKRRKPDYAAICWFKHSATEHLARMHEMTDILELYGFMITRVKSRKPGYIVYEDEEQVAAIPYTKLARLVL